MHMASIHTSHLLTICITAHSATSSAEPIGSTIDFPDTDTARSSSRINNKVSAFASLLKSDLATQLLGPLVGTLHPDFTEQSISRTLPGTHRSHYRNISIAR